MAGSIVVDPKQLAVGRVFGNIAAVAPISRSKQNAANPRIKINRAIEITGNINIAGVIRRHALGIAIGILANPCHGQHRLIAGDVAAAENAGTGGRADSFAIVGRHLNGNAEFMVRRRIDVKNVGCCSILLDAVDVPFIGQRDWIVVDIGSRSHGLQCAGESRYAAFVENNSDRRRGIRKLIRTDIHNIIDNASIVTLVVVDIRRDQRIRALVNGRAAFDKRNYLQIGKGSAIGKNNGRAELRINARDIRIDIIRRDGCAGRIFDEAVIGFDRTGNVIDAVIGHKRVVERGRRINVIVVKTAVVIQGDGRIVQRQSALLVPHSTARTAAGRVAGDGGIGNRERCSGVVNASALGVDAGR